MLTPTFKTHGGDKGNPNIGFDVMHSAVSLLAALFLVALIVCMVLWMPR